MFVLQCEISIGNYLFDFVNELVVESSWKNQTDTARITLPAALKVDRDRLSSIFKKGDAVSIRIGYDGKLNNVFSGYVARIKPTTPIAIECEDEMWKLKQVTVNSNAKSEKLQDYLQRVLPIEADCFDIVIPSFVAHNITGAQLLNEFKSDYGFHSFFRNGKLVVGKQYDPEDNTTHKVIIDNSQNSNVAGQGLEYQEKDDVKLKVTAISTMSDGTKHEVEIGNPDGEARTLNFYNVPKSDLQKLAEKEMERFNYTGYKGDVTLFGEPFVRHGQRLELYNDQSSDKTGKYFIDAVTYNYGLGGFRQQVTIGPKI